ncbi:MULTISPECIES: hypothetical protein [unclassified Streptomyces]|uniref:hypothetical protein n=1 Tax=unclassified Streptomyces TaxID=2593676 RepID=UPI00278C1FAE|nr:MULTISPECIES: hypothetical protein [unclassified Streptomyces]
MAFVIGGLTVSTALGMLLGNMIGSVDRRLTLWAVTALGVVTALAAATLLLGISPLAVDNLAVVIIWAGIRGITDGAPSVIQQYRLVSFTPASAPVLFGLNSSAWPPPCSPRPP